MRGACQPRILAVEVEEVARKLGPGRSEFMRGAIDDRLAAGRVNPVTVHAHFAVNLDKSRHTAKRCRDLSRLNAIGIGAGEPL